MKKSKLILLIVAFIGVMVGAGLLYSQLSDRFDGNDMGIHTENNTENNTESNTESTESEPEVYPAPDFTVYDMDGNEVNFSDFLGKPVVINFWATWCGVCESEFPAFEKVAKEYEEEVTFLMINLTDGIRETMEGAKQFIEENSYTFPVYFDTEYSASSVYGVYSIPTTVFINAEGNLSSAYISAMSEEKLTSYVEALIEESAEENTEDNGLGYLQISQEEAKNLMDTEENYIILDVRTIEEFEAGHIAGAICVPNETIGDIEPAELPDKDQLILVYCRSGNRSKQAAEKLVALGYTNIQEFGGINTWEYEVE